MDSLFPALLVANATHNNTLGLAVFSLGLLNSMESEPQRKCTHTDRAPRTAEKRQAERELEEWRRTEAERKRRNYRIWLER